MIRFNDVSKIYHVGQTEVRALYHASMQIEEGEFVSIIGPSGSGKSTMMNIIGCLDMADEGQYLLDGQAIEEYTETELARIRNKKIGFIFQNFNLIGNMTAKENIELPLLYQKLPKNVRKERVEEALEKVRLKGRGLHKPNELSGGQQQRVAIARAIAARPSLFLADEPTGNLDSRTGADIMGLFHELHEAGSTIVLITHDREVAAQASRSIHILDGQVKEEKL
ncbi:ABC transporter ATP-binding protein [[Clostridium] scindens]|uniref:ABC transporter ATP-binding protein n=1 Tax=Clostridium scindens (strain JCM 10418 / VPI 12708) TaxID=29347 RepID=UPI003AB99FE6